MITRDPTRNIIELQGTKFEAVAKTSVRGYQDFLYDEGPSPHRVKFLKSTSSITLAGSTNNNEAYVLGARKGQRVQLDFFSKDAMASATFNARGGKTLGTVRAGMPWSGTLPANGDYTISITSKAPSDSSDVYYSLNLLSEPPDIEPPLQGALTPEPADPDALLKVANEVAATIKKRSVDAGIGEVEQAVVAKLIVFIATSLPPEVAKQLTLNPRGLAGWAARITGKELVRDIAKVDPIGFALGVASEALVEFIRNEMPHSTTAQNFKIEGLALLIRESTVAYAYARGGMHAAVAAQTIVSGTTLFEAIQGGAELAWATYTQPQRDRRERMGAEFLTLRATFKAETNAERKAQALALLDAFLAGPGRPLFEAFPDPDGQRKIYVCTLAKASNIEWQCA